MCNTRGVINKREEASLKSRQGANAGFTHGQSMDTHIPLSLSLTHKQPKNTQRKRPNKGNQSRM